MLILGVELHSIVASFKRISKTCTIEMMKKKLIIFLSFFHAYELQQLVNMFETYSFGRTGFFFLLNLQLQSDNFSLSCITNNIH